jgi:hypothetical protein
MHPEAIELTVAVARMMMGLIRAVASFLFGL